MEGVSKEDIARDAEAIGQLMEAVLTQEKEKKEKAKVSTGWNGRGRWSGGDVLIVMNGRRRVTIALRVPTMPGRSTSGFHRAGRRR